MGKVLTTAARETNDILTAAMQMFRLSAIEQIAVIKQAEAQVLSGQIASSAKMRFGPVMDQSELKDGDLGEETIVSDALRSLEVLERFARLPQQIIDHEVDDLLGADWQNYQPWMTKMLRDHAFFPQEVAAWSLGERKQFFIPGEGKSLTVAEGYDEKSLKLQVPAEQFVLRAELDMVMNLYPGPSWQTDTFMFLKDEAGLRVRVFGRKPGAKYPKLTDEFLIQQLERALRGNADLRQLNRHLGRVQDATAQWLPGYSIFVEGDWHGNVLHHEGDQHSVRVHNSYFTKGSGFLVEQEGFTNGLRLLMLGWHNFFHRIATQEVETLPISDGKRSARQQRDLTRRILEPDQLFKLTDRKKVGVQSASSGSGKGGWEQEPHTRIAHKRRKWGHSKLPPDQQEWIEIKEVRVRADKDEAPGLRPGTTIVVGK